MGQSEIAVADMVDIFVLLLPPAAGDELQVCTCVCVYAYVRRFYADIHTHTMHTCVCTHTHTHTHTQAKPVAAVTQSFLPIQAGMPVHHTRVYTVKLMYIIIMCMCFATGSKERHCGDGRCDRHHKGRRRLSTSCQESTSRIHQCTQTYTQKD